MAVRADMDFCRNIGIGSFILKKWECPKRVRDSSVVYTIIRRLFLSTVQIFFQTQFKRNIYREFVSVIFR